MWKSENGNFQSIKSNYSRGEFAGEERPGKKGQGKKAGVSQKQKTLTAY